MLDPSARGMATVITDPARLFGLPVSANGRFRLGDRKYFVGAGGVRTLRLFAELCYAPAATDPLWLVRRRTQIRMIQRLNRRALLSLIVQSTENPTLRVLAIWLRGRCRGSLGARMVASFSAAPDAVTRKEVARALKRMGAWAPLERIAAEDPNPRIRRIATLDPPREHADRLAKFLRHSHRLDVAPRPTTLIVACEQSKGRPAKPSWRIAAVLERIRMLVSQGRKRRERRAI